MSVLFDVEPVPAQPPRAATERQMLDALHDRYGSVQFGARRFAIADHVPSHPHGPAAGARVADFIAVDSWRPYDLSGHEVKVSRSDWLRELADPFKAAEFLPYMHLWWLVVPDKRIVRDGELPDGWGLMTLTSRGLRAGPRAVRREAEPLSAARLAGLLRAVQKTASRGAA